MLLSARAPQKVSFGRVLELPFRRRAEDDEVCEVDILCTVWLLVVAERPALTEDSIDAAERLKGRDRVEVPSIVDGDKPIRLQQPLQRLQKVVREQYSRFCSTCEDVVHNVVEGRQLSILNVFQRIFILNIDLGIEAEVLLREAADAGIELNGGRVNTVGSEGAGCGADP